MDRQHRHDLKHDKFVDEIGALSDRARQNQRLLMIIGGALLLAALLFYGYRFFRDGRESKAQDLLAVAIETFEAPVGDAATAQPGTPAPKFKTEAERTAAAEKQFKDVQAQYSGSDAADVANLYLARIASGKGDVKTAQTLLKEFVDEHAGHTLAGGARYSLYQLRIENGEAAQVVTELEAELKKSEPVLPGDALLTLIGDAYEKQGNMDKSREAFRRIATEFPESPYVVDAQRRAGA